MNTSLNSKEEFLSTRTVTSLAAKAPVNPKEIASAAGLPYIVEQADWGRRFVIAFEDPFAANPEAATIRRLVEIAPTPETQSFGQICLDAP